jgi:pimeloyl-ACP methyl ester carboxylesterase
MAHPQLVEDCGREGGVLHAPGDAHGLVPEVAKEAVFEHAPELRPDPPDAVGISRIGAAKRLMFDAAECLQTYDRPALVVWASRDRVMPPEHGHLLAELLPRGRLVEVPESYTLIPLDQPALLAQTIGKFTSHLPALSRPLNQMNHGGTR